MRRPRPLMTSLATLSALGLTLKADALASSPPTQPDAATDPSTDPSTQRSTRVEAQPEPEPQQGQAQAQAPASDDAPATWRALIEVLGIVPDPLDAPAPKQLKLGLERASAWGGFWRGRLGLSRRSLGTDLLAIAEVGWGSASRFGLTFDVALGLGYRHQWTRGDLYAAREDGSIAQVTDWGTPLAMTTLSLGLGYDLRPRWGLPLRVWLTPRHQLTWPQWGQVGMEGGAGLRLDMAW